MHIDHVAIWTDDLERIKSFYERHFGAVTGSKYQNVNKQFESYFLSFPSGARIEIMKQPGITPRGNYLVNTQVGYAHLSIACGSEQAVDKLTEQLRKDGYRVVDGPRRTGDGYYESVILDPDGNHIEITV
jgi:lactoylglutathione lyase